MVTILSFSSLFLSIQRNLLTSETVVEAAAENSNCFSIFKSLLDLCSLDRALQHSVMVRCIEGNCLQHLELLFKTYNKVLSSLSFVFFQFVTKDTYFMFTSSKTTGRAHAFSNLDLTKYDPWKSVVENGRDDLLELLLNR